MKIIIIILPGSRLTRARCRRGYSALYETLSRSAGCGLGRIHNLARRLDHDRVLEGEQLRLVLAEASARLKAVAEGKDGAGEAPGDMAKQDPLASHPAARAGSDLAGRPKPRSGPRP